MKDTDGRKNNRGAKGKAGAKKKSDLKKPVTAYIKQSRINELGGIEKTREFVIKFVG